MAQKRFSRSEASNTKEHVVDVICDLHLVNHTIGDRSSRVQVAVSIEHWDWSGELLHRQSVFVNDLSMNAQALTTRVYKRFDSMRAFTNLEIHGNCQLVALFSFDK